MTTVLVDNEAFKITLQIVEDFINDDYDAFIENGPTDDIKLITWKMEIYFKKLEGKKNSIVEYYMTPIYKLLKQSFYGHKMNDHTNQLMRNFDFSLTISDKEGYPHIINALTLDFKKNILAKTITINIICDETYNFNCIKYGSSSTETQTKKYNYLNQLQSVIIGRIIGCCNSISNNEKIIHKYYESRESMITDKRINLNDDNVIWLKNIVKDHYSEILKNIEAYILYCKTEKIDIDFKKIVDRITFIKEHVKENYDITLV